MKAAATTWRPRRSTTCSSNPWGPKFYDRDGTGVPTRWVEMVRHTLQSLGPKVLASRMVRDYTEKYYAPAAQSLRRTVQPIDGLPFGAARELTAYRLRAREAWPKIAISDVDSTGLPDTPLLGSELTLTAAVQLAGLKPDEVAVQAVLGRVDAADVLQHPTCVDDGAHRVRRRRHRDLLHHDAASGGRIRRLHRAGVAAPPAVGRGHRAGPRHARVSRILEVAVGGGPYALAAGSDGAMWVTLVHGGEIARVTADGGLRVYPVAPESKPSIIVAGPDGALVVHPCR